VEALTAIAGPPGEHCPVCVRDFSEVSPMPPAAHVSEEVARLITASFEWSADRTDVRVRESR
jgi:DNA repair protein SbcC/Rad50